jgi:phospholipase/lecithinase/hemolysin
VQQLHASGARTIIVGNQSPQGCSGSILTPFLGTGPYDTIGCLDEYNKVNRVFNKKLKQALTDLQESYKTDGTLIIQFDFYSALIELFTNPAQYGFNSSTRLEVCCGFGGAYNYNRNVTCGDSGNVSLSTGGTKFVNITTAPNPKEHIEWDGIHYTQATYKVIASFFLSGQFFISPLGFNFKHLCNLDFSQF